MYKNAFLGLLIFSFIIPVRIYAQQKSAINIVDERSINNEQVYPVAGSDLLREKDLEVAQFLKNNPGYLEQKKLMKSEWSFGVGSTHPWLAYNFTNDQNYFVASTCRAVGTNCYIFVADDQWNSNVNQTAVNAVANEFDNHTPANPGKGIYQTCIDTYGNPPNVDGDSKIIILILDITDGYTGSGGYVAGYFYSRNEVTDNNTEIYFMDSNPGNLASEGGLNFAFATAAHEFQHMINWNYHQGVQELTFINESLSKSAEILGGYGASMQGLYANETNHYLFDWRTGDNTLVLNDYARAQRFSLYLMEQFGVSSLKEFVQSYSTYGLLGVDGLKKVLAQHSTSLGKVLLNWEIANGLNDITIDPAYGYSYEPLPISTGTTIHNPNIAPTGSTVINLGAEYFTFINSSNLTVTFSAAGTNMVVKAIEIGEGSSRVVDVPLNSSFSEPDYPSVYNTIRFAVVDTNESSSQAYQYQSSGTVAHQVMELTYDTEYSGNYTLGFSAGSKQAVIFNGAPGFIIDSVKADIQGGSNPLAGEIWTYTGNISDPLETKISSDFSVQVAQGTHSWVTTSLHEQNINAGNNFVVLFNLSQSVESGGSSVIVTKKSGEAFSNTIFNNSEGLWQWYTDGEGNTWLNRIRVYITIVTGGIKEVVELNPMSYSLQQNYPNPFNPGTKIKYSIPESGNVSIVINDITGRKVIELLNGFQNAGTYEAVWDGKNESGLSVTSGMYFYSLKAGTFTQTKKMILMK